MNFGSIQPKQLDLIGGLKDVAQDFLKLARSEGYLDLPLDSDIAQLRALRDENKRLRNVAEAVLFQKVRTFPNRGIAGQEAYQKYQVMGQKAISKQTPVNSFIAEAILAAQSIQESALKFKIPEANKANYLGIRENAFREGGIVKKQLEDFISQANKTFLSLSGVSIVGKGKDFVDVAFVDTGKQITDIIEKTAPMFETGLKYMPQILIGAAALYALGVLAPIVSAVRGRR